MTFQLLGTPSQQTIVHQALAACDFPFERLRPKLKAETGRDAIPVEWVDLSRYSAQVSEAAASGKHLHIHEDDDTGHPVGTREQVLGLAWYSGKVSLDYRLENDPRLAMEVFLSEGAHMVDFFYMTDEERSQIAKMWDPNDDPNIDWFDVGPYETWMGESFMGQFIASFAPTIGVTLTQFLHQPTAESTRFVRELLLRTPQPEPRVELDHRTIDYWAMRERIWWPRYARKAAQAWRAWRNQ